MTKQLLWVANHPIPAELLADENYEVIELPADLKALWGAIPATGVASHIEPIIELASSIGAVMVAGEPRACFHVASAVGAENAFATYSVRESVDQPQADGTVKKVSVFRYGGLFSYAS